MAPLLLAIFLLVSFGTAHAQFLEISSDKSHYSEGEEILLSTRANEAFGDITVTIYEHSDYPMYEDVISSKPNQMRVEFSDIYNGDGRYTATISYLDADKSTSFDVGISPKDVPPMPEITSDSMESRESDVKPEIKNDYNVLVAIIITVISALLITFIVKVILDKIISRRNKSRTIKNVKPIDNVAPRTIRQDHVKPIDNKLEPIEKNLGRKPCSNVDARTVNERSELEREYGTERLPDFGKIIPDTNMLIDNLEGNMSLNRLYPRFLIFDIVDMEFYKGRETSWYKGLEQKTVIFDKSLMEKIRAIYKEEGPELVERVKKKFGKKIEVDGTSSPSDDFLIREARIRKLYKKSEIDRMLIAQAITYAEDTTYTNQNANTCLLTQDYDILVYARKIKELSGGKLVVVSGYEFRRDKT